jgi:hypothetical protein
MSFEEEREWMKKARKWQITRSEEIAKQLRLPFDLLREMTRENVPKKYIAAAIPILQERLQQIERAGWDLVGLDTILKIARHSLS